MIVYQPILITVLVSMYVQGIVQVILGPVSYIVHLFVILKELVHVTLIVKRMESSAVTINIHVRVILKLQEILLVYAMFKLVLHMAQNVVVTVRIIGIVLIFAVQIVLVFVLAKQIHVHVTLIVLQMMNVLTCVDAIIIVHVINKL